MESVTSAPKLYPDSSSSSRIKQGEPDEPVGPDEVVTARRRLGIPEEADDEDERGDARAAAAVVPCSETKSRPPPSAEDLARLMRGARALVLDSTRARVEEAARAVATGAAPHDHRLAALAVVAGRLAVGSEVRSPGALARALLGRQTADERASALVTTEVDSYGWAWLDAAAMACDVAEHGRMAPRQNGETGRWFAVCRTCGATANPGSRQAAATPDPEPASLGRRRDASGAAPVGAVSVAALLGRTALLRDHRLPWEDAS